MKFLIASTFKSHKTSAEVEQWFQTVIPESVQSSAEIVVAPSFLHLSVAHDIVNSRQSAISLAAQDVSPFPPGSYTGAVNAVQLQDMGIRYCLVGHSERRTYFHESSVEVANKIRELTSSGITPIVCVSKSDISSQSAALEGVDREAIIFCYEPPEGIGGTVTAPTEEIVRVAQEIRDKLGTRVMYGGSVTADNLTSLLTLGLEGVLVSTASLDPEGFTTILRTYESNRSL